MCSLQVKWVHLFSPVGLLCLGGPFSHHPTTRAIIITIFLVAAYCSWAEGLAIATDEYSLYRPNAFLCGALPSTLASDVIMLGERLFFSPHLTLS